MTRIDFHAHLRPADYVSVLPDAAKAMLVPLPTEADLEALMTRCSLDAVVLSAGPPGAFFGDQIQANEIARAANESLAGVVARNPIRFASMALLPLPDVDAALRELEHALDVLGIDGVMLLSHVNGTYLGDPALEPLMAELSRRGAYVLLHPGLPPYAPTLPHHPIWVYEIPLETTRAVCNLVYSGTLDRHPGIRWQLAHMGGDVPFLSHRLASLADREPEKAACAERSFLEYLPDFYYDTGLSNGAPPIRATAEVAPFERVLFGSDWPHCALPEDGDPFPGLAALSVAERRGIESVHGAELVPRLTA